MKVASSIFNLAYIVSSLSISALGFFFVELTGGLLYEVVGGGIARCSAQEGSGADSDAVFFTLSFFVLPSIIRLLRIWRSLALTEIALLILLTLLVFGSLLGNTCGDLHISSQANSKYFVALHSSSLALLFSTIGLAVIRFVGRGSTRKGP